MPDSRPPSAREKITRLRASFVAQLPQRLARIESLCAQLMQSAPDDAQPAELHRELHSLKGTGRSFGFHALGSAAGECEDVVASFIDTAAAAPPPDWQNALASAMDHIRSSLATLATEPAQPSNATTSVFTLPAHSEQHPTQLGARRIYLCDDEPLPLEQLANQIRCFGYEIATFTDTQHLHAAVLAQPPDALVLDINFPQGRSAGIESLTKLRQEMASPIPTIFLSARNDFEARLAAVQAGADAYFHKPARASELVATLDTLTRQQNTEPLRVLVVDDEAEVAAYHSILLQEAQMLTRQLSDPSQVFQVLQEFRPDLVLMDMYMPLCTGRDLAKLIRQVPDYVSLPIVYLSSETDWKKQFSAMRVGAEGFLTKPVVPQELVAAVAVRAERMRTLRALMARDSLTGLFNHTTTSRLLDNALTSAQRNQTTTCFAMLDLDKFKLVNDTYGHPTGDQVLLALSRVLQQRLRHSDVIGRYGGEEFAVVLHDIPVASAFELLDALREDFSHVIFHAQERDFSCTFSAGLASFPAHADAEALRGAADRALYAAKHQGRNRIVQDDTGTTTTAIDTPCIAQP
ncbi:MAG: diguanylate cyclase [Rhodoferax sp.]|nr:diguanylate cyclase [Rhodoferax sp.]